jgi:hypothetical protein
LWGRRRDKALSSVWDLSMVFLFMPGVYKKRGAQGGDRVP